MMDIAMLVSGFKTKNRVKVWKHFQMENHIKANSKMEMVTVKENLHMPMVHLSKEYLKMRKSGKVKELKSIEMEARILVNSIMESITAKEN